MHISLNSIFIILFYIFINFKCIANELPKTVSYMVADGDCCGGEEDVPSTASEWIFQTKNGNFASVVDLGFGIGLEILTDN